MPLGAAELLERARRVRLVAFDVDGVLTDGLVTYGPAGEAVKTFHIRDGHGMVLLRLAGIPCAILSARDSEIVRARMRELGVFHLFQGERDKAAGLSRLCGAARVEPEEVAFMGDDLNDLPALERCGLSAAPADAEEAVRARVHFVARQGGGRGAARELCDLVLAARAMEP